MPRSSMRSTLLLSLLLPWIGIGAAQADEHLLGDFWEPIQARPGAEPVRSSQEQWLRLDEEGVARHLAVLPKTDTQASLPLALPTRDGEITFFEVRRSHTMASALAEKYPEIQTFQATSADGLTQARIELGPHGLSAMVFAPQAVSLIERGSGGQAYVSFVRERTASSPGFVCGVHGDVIDAEHLKSAHDHAPAQASPKAIGPTLRTYRTAIAATGEYTASFGGRVVDGLAGIVVAVNRINQIYETELGLRLELIPNNDLIVYTNSATDPYTNNNGSTMLGQNANNLSATIGNANFDFGHVFSTGGGGVATLGGICGNSKARGVTGQGNPRNDPFWVDFVAHEMGHQLNGPHTFNGSTGSCSGGNRSGASAYEIGSGTTIMAYAGICGGENTQSNSDPFFHVSSLARIHTFTQTGLGSTCGTTSATGNQTPVVTATPNATIPARTPFALTANATDPDTDTLTYLWEQYDLGTATNATTVLQDDGVRPLFRSFDASPSPTRLFPRLENILSGTPTIGEILPTTNRTLNFRVTVRDNREGGGGVQWSGASALVPQTTLNVINTGQSFALTTANSPTSWAAGNTQTVTWNVAGTDANGINCAQVNIDFSLDRGLSFPISLATAVDNNGSHDITVPDQTTANGRIRVACSNNIFFNINTADITVTGGNEAPVLSLASSTVAYVNNGPAVRIDANAVITDADSTDFDGGLLRVEIINNGEFNDRLDIEHQGDGSSEVGITLDEVRYEGVVIGSVNGGQGVTPLSIAFNADSSPIAAQAVLRAIRYGSAGEVTGTLPRIVRASISDGDGGQSLARTRTISIQVNPMPIVNARFVTDIGSSNARANAPILYTLLFSKDIDFISVDVGDFDNAGSSPIVISDLTPINARTLTLIVTATDIGTLTLRIPATADIVDTSGLPLQIPVVDLTTYVIDPPDPRFFSDGFED